MRRAFTMVEIMVVCGLLMLVLMPTYRILSHGGRSAVKGVQRNSVVMSGQQLIAGLKADLSLAAFVIEDGASHDIHDVFSEAASGDDLVYSFKTFNGGRFEDKVVATSDGPESYRRLNQIEYRLTNRDGSPFKTLVRTITYHPRIGTEPNTQTLSENVNFFEIKPETITSNGVSRSFFRISLQLFDQDEISARGSAVDLSQLFIADFMDTVNPKILNVIISNPGMNRNWYTDAHDLD